MRHARLPLLFAAGFASLATSAPTTPPMPWLGDGYLAVHNGGPVPLVIRMERTRDVDSLNCALLAEAPALLAFVPLESGVTAERLEPSEVHLIGDVGATTAEGCGVARLEVDRLGVRRVFWPIGGAWAPYPPTLTDPSDSVGALISLDPTAPDPFRDGRDAMVFLEDPDGLPVCDGTAEIGWDGPTGRLKVLDRELSKEGCPTLSVAHADGTHDALILCVPPAFAPFPLGAAIDVVSDGTHLRVVDLESGVTLRVAVDDEVPWDVALEAEQDAWGCALPAANTLHYRPGLMLDGEPLMPGEIREILHDGEPALLSATTSLRAVAPAAEDGRPTRRAALLTGLPFE